MSPPVFSHSPLKKDQILKTSFQRTAVEYVRLEGHSYANSHGAESAKLTKPDKGPCDPEEMWGGQGRRKNDQSCETCAVKERWPGQDRRLFRPQIKVWTQVWNEAQNLAQIPQNTWESGLKLGLACWGRLATLPRSGSTSNCPFPCFGMCSTRVKNSSHHGGGGGSGSGGGAWEHDAPFLCAPLSHSPKWFMNHSNYPAPTRQQGLL